MGQAVLSVRGGPEATELPLALIAVWQAASAWGWLSTRVLPAPLDVLRAAWALAESGELWTHVKVSAGRALAGLAVFVAKGLHQPCIAVTAGGSDFDEHALEYSAVVSARKLQITYILALHRNWETASSVHVSN